MIIKKQVWPPPEKFYTTPRHMNWRKEDWTKAMEYVKEIYPFKMKKYEYNLFNEKWKNCAVDWQYSTAKKIDCVIEISDTESDILESDPALWDETLGQLLVYRHHYEIQTNKKVRNMIALTRENQEQTNEVMKKFGIKIILAKTDGTFELI